MSAIVILLAYGNLLGHLTAAHSVSRAQPCWAHVYLGPASLQLHKQVELTVENNVAWRERERRREDKYMQIDMERQAQREQLVENSNRVSRHSAMYTVRLSVRSWSSPGGTHALADPLAIMGPIHLRRWQKIEQHVWRLQCGTRRRCGQRLRRRSTLWKIDWWALRGGVAQE